MGIRSFAAELLPSALQGFQRVTALREIAAGEVGIEMLRRVPL